MPERRVQKQRNAQGINATASVQTQQEAVYKADELKTMQDSLITGSRLIDSMKTTASMSQWAKNDTIPDKATVESSYESSRAEAFKNASVMDSHSQKRKKRYMDKAGDQVVAANIVKKIFTERENAKAEFLSVKPAVIVEEKDVSFADDWSAYFATFDKKGQVDKRFDHLEDIFSGNKAKQKTAAWAMLRQIRIADLDKYDFKDDDRFMLKFNDHYKELCAFSNAQKLLDTVDTGIVDANLVKLRAKIRALNEIREAYENRMQILQSPYYALLMASDLKQGDPKYEELKDKMKDNAGAKAYFDAVEKKAALKFGKGQSAEELYKSHLDETEDYKQVHEHEEFEKRKESFLVNGLKEKDYPPELFNIRVCTNMFYNTIKEEAPSDRTEYLKQLDKIIQAYSEMNKSYQEYIDSFKKKESLTKKDKAALSLAEEILSQYKKEQGYFEISRTNTAVDFSKHIEGEWPNIIYNIRTVKIDKKDSDIETVGAGTSIIYKVKGKDGVVSFVKKEERMVNPEQPRDLADYLVLECDPQIKDLVFRISDGSAKTGANPKAFMRLAVTSLASVASKLPVPVHKDDDTPEQIDAQEKSYMKSVLGLLESEVGDLGKICNRLFLEDMSFFDTFKRMMSQLGKKYNEYMVAHDAAHIEEGLCVSDRNAATSIMAGRLGVSDIVARSETVYVETEAGELVRANAMEQVDGIEAGKFMHKAAEEQAKVEYSPEALGQMFTLQVFDMICGQVDRNANNYMITDYEIRRQLVGGKEEEVRVIKSIKAIDNDMSFGCLSSEVIEDGHREMRGFCDKKYGNFGYIKFLPKEFVDRIRAYNDLEAVKADFAGLRSDAEINALYERLKAVREEMDKRLASDDDDCRILQYDDVEDLKGKYAQALEDGVLDRAKATLGADLTQFVQWNCVGSKPKEGEEKPQVIQIIHEEHKEDSAMKQAHIEVQSAKEELLKSKVRHGLITYSDSTMMEELKASIGTLNKELNKPIQRGAKFETGKKPLEDAYKAVIEKCSTYLEEKETARSKDGKRRLELVRHILEQSEKEYAAFSKLTQQELKINQYMLTQTWTDVLYGVRAVKISLGDDRVKVVGAGTSIIYRVQEEDGTSSYVKPEEAIVSEKSAINIVSEYAKVAPPEMMEVVEFFELKLNRMEWLKDWMESYNLDVEMEAAQNKSAAAWQQGESEEDYKKRVEESRYNAYKAILVKWLGKNKEFRELFQRKETECVRFLQMYFKKSNEFETATSVAKIKEGSVISNRNVSTSRVAKSLNISEIIAESSTVLIQKDDKSPVRANSMEGVESRTMSDLRDYCQHEKIEIVYSPVVIKQLLTLQVFDYICGQVDRHMNNYAVFYRLNDQNKMEITGLKAIDNDMAFGSGITEKKGLNYMSWLKNDFGKINVPFLDKAFYMRLMEYTPQMAEFEQADLRTPEEIEALKKRLENVRTELAEMVKNGETILIDDDQGWEGKVDEMKRMRAEGKMGTGYLYSGHIID